MKIIKKIKISFMFCAVFTALISLQSCGGTSKDEALMEASSTETTATEITPNTQGPDIQVPSPGEMLQFIKILGGKTNKITSFKSNCQFKCV